MRVPVVLQILPAFDSGGVENVALDMGIYLAQITQKKVSFIASSGGKFEKKALAAGIVHCTLPLQSKNPLNILWNGFQLAKLIRQHQIELLHVRSRAPGWSALIAAKLTKTPIITTYHGIYKSQNFFKKLYNSVMVRGRSVIAISQYIQNHITQEYPWAQSKIQLIYEGINTASFSMTNVSDRDIYRIRAQWGVKPHQKVILLPGRLAKGKGHIVALRALKELLNPDYRLIFLGSSQGKKDYLSILENEINKLGLSGQVNFVPDCDNIPLAYAASNVILSIGTTPESFGRVAVEAGAMERVLIGVQHGATPELCLNGQTGFLVSPNNPQELSEKIEDIFHYDADSYRTIGQRARQFICAHYSLEEMCKNTLDIYEKVAFPS